MAYLSPDMIAMLHKAVRAADGVGVPVRGGEHNTARALARRHLGFHFPGAGRFYANGTLRELVAAAHRGDI